MALVQDRAGHIAGVAGPPLDVGGDVAAATGLDGDSASCGEATGDVDRIGSDGDAGETLPGSSCVAYQRSLPVSGLKPHSSFATGRSKSSSASTGVL